MGVCIKQKFFTAQTEFVLETSLRCFYPDGYTAKEELQWRNKWRHGDLLLLAESDTDPSVLYGGLRMRPIEINRRDQTFYMLGICETFVEPFSRGMGLAEKLTLECIETARNQLFEGILVIARRAIDGFYLKHGFYGAGSYPEVQIKNIDQFRRFNPTENQAGVKISQSSSSSVFHDYYLSCYSQNFGSIERSQRDMQLILESLPIMVQGAELMMISVDGRTKGYLVLCNNKVIEIAFDLTLSTDCKKSLICCIGDYLNTSNFALALHPSHPLIACNLGFDITVSNRTCPYGGHVVRVINVDSMKAKFIDREQRRIDAISSSAAIIQEEISRQYRLDSITTSEDNPPSLDQTLMLLGAMSTFNNEAIYQTVPLFIPQLDWF